MAVTSGCRTLGLPPTDLHAAPPLGPLLRLELAAVVTANALRVHQVAVAGDSRSGEPVEVTDARILARACDQFVQLLNDSRRSGLARLTSERNE